MSARASSSARGGLRGDVGLAARRERAKTAGAIWRQASQSMQLSSTKKAPGAFSSRRSARRATTPMYYRERRCARGPPLVVAVAVALAARRWLTSRRRTIPTCGGTWRRGARRGRRGRRCRSIRSRSASRARRGATRISSPTWRCGGRSRAAGSWGCWRCGCCARSASRSAGGWRATRRRRIALPLVVATGVTVLLMPWADRPNLLVAGAVPDGAGAARAAALRLARGRLVAVDRAAPRGAARLRARRRARALELGVARLVRAAAAPVDPRRRAAGGAARRGRLRGGGRWRRSSGSSIRRGARPSRAPSTSPAARSCACTSPSGSSSASPRSSTATALLALATLAALVARLAVAVRRRERAPVDAWHVALVVAVRRARHAQRALAALPRPVVRARPPPPRRRGEACARRARRRRSPARRRGRRSPSSRGAAPRSRSARIPSLQPVGRRRLRARPRARRAAAVALLRVRRLPPLPRRARARRRAARPGLPAGVRRHLHPRRAPPERCARTCRRRRWAIGSNGETRWTHRDLFADPAWAEVYWSEAASVYVGAPRIPRSLRSPTRVIDPAAPELERRERGALARSRRASPRARAELGRMLAASPTSVRANRAAGDLLPPDRRRRVARRRDRACCRADDAAELQRRFTSSATATAN